MKMNIRRIPNLVVYSALYAAICAISIWLLVFHPESPTNWILYILMIGSVLVGIVKLALHSRKQRQQSL
jgi:uncharacterized membrane protein YeiH